jgi:hypothetical protein
MALRHRTCAHRWRGSARCHRSAPAQPLPGARCGRCEAADTSCSRAGCATALAAPLPMRRSSHARDACDVRPAATCSVLAATPPQPPHTQACPASSRCVQSTDHLPCAVRAVDARRGCGILTVTIDLRGRRWCGKQEALRRAAADAAPAPRCGWQKAGWRAAVCERDCLDGTALQQWPAEQIHARGADL